VTAAHTAVIGFLDRRGHRPSLRNDVARDATDKMGSR
jgi:hypothetical protein